MTAAGMETLRLRAALHLAQTARVDTTMRVAGSSDTITVAAPAPSVIDNPQVSTSLMLPFIERLPVQRNQLATAQFAPGVNGNTLANGQLYISGGPGYDNLVLVNGVVVTENTRGQMRPMYVEDAIQETTVLTGAISAEYGRFSGGVVNTITKSGGNELAGSFRDSLSNPSWVGAVAGVGNAREQSQSRRRGHAGRVHRTRPPLVLRRGTLGEERHGAADAFHPGLDESGVARVAGDQLCRGERPEEV